MCVYFGCTESDAYNYDAGANTDDGTCLYAGCMDSDADNYDVGADVDDAQCHNYDPDALKPNPIPTTEQLRFRADNVEDGG